MAKSGSHTINLYVNIDLISLNKKFQYTLTSYHKIKRVGSREKKNYLITMGYLLSKDPKIGGEKMTSVLDKW